MRILLVEDEMDLAAVLTTALSRHDIVVDHARSLEIAAEACRSGVHDAVLLDRKLPDGEGLSRIAGLAGAGQLRTVIEHRFLLAQAAEALRLSMAGHVRGKIVLTLD